LFHLRIRDLYYMLMVPNAGSKKKVTAFLVMVFSQLIGFTAALYIIYSFGTVAGYKDYNYLSYIMATSTILGFLVFYLGTRKRECLKFKK
jgi:predicted benzoate:H+ symporter BenE